jgi:hypothetical protein
MKLRAAARLVSPPVLSALVFCVPALAGGAGTVRHYEIDATIVPERGELRATVALTLVAPEGGLGRIQLLLNRGLAVRSLTCDAGVKGFRFDRSEPSPYRYAPTASPLTIELRETLEADRSTVVRLTYEGAIEPDTWGANVLTRDWVELGMYAAWYPYDPDSKSFTYEVRLKADASYAVSGLGALSGSESGWTLRQEDPAWDIVVVAARGLRARRVDDGRLGIEVWHVNLDDEQADRFGRDVGRIMEEMRGAYGPISTKNLTIVFAERKSGGGYYRPGFMSLIFDPDYRGLVRYAAHEVAHFWWGRASATTREDWLNESFAEYSALLLMRRWYGPDVFSECLASYEREAEKTPAIWGLDRNDKDAFNALYRKGPVLLHRLEERLGTEAFQRFLAALVAREVRTTEALLSTLEELTSRDVRAEFEQGLRR